MMKGKMMEEKTRIPENGSPIPVLHHFAKYIQFKNADVVRFIHLRGLKLRGMPRSASSAAKENGSRPAMCAACPILSQPLA